MAFACHQRVFDSLSVRDVVKQYSDFVTAVVPQAKRVNVKPSAAKIFCLVLEPDSFSSDGYLSISLKPVGFVIWRDLPHSLALRIANSGVLFKRRIDFNKSVVGRLAVSVKDHLDHAVTFVY